jgi:hypothetical protein
LNLHSNLSNDSSTPNTFGCGCLTPNVSNGNPVLESGAARIMHLGLKLTF